MESQKAIWLRQKNGGGAEEARTPDPLLAKQVLSQLSYSPLEILLNSQLNNWRVEGNQ